MTDIVERLRARADDKFIRDAPLMHEAAAELERLQTANDYAYGELAMCRAEIARLQAELARIRGLPRLAALDEELERLRAIAENAEALRRNLEDVSCRQQNEIGRLRDHMRALADTSEARDTAGIFKGLWQGSEKECDELRADNERLQEQVAALQASSGYETSIAQLELERLGALATIVREQGFAIEELRAANERLRTTLGYLADNIDDPALVAVAETALKAKP